VGSSIFLSNTSTQVLLFGTAGWHDNTGALTFCKWTEGCTGEISAANSLVGAQPGDKVGSYYSFLPNGDYVTNTQWWHNGSKAEAGATTWCSGQTGCQGIVSALNSLVGSQTGDRVSGGFILPLQNGSFLVGNPDWDNGGLIDAGALTFCSGAGGCQGMISPANSLVGSTAGDRMGTGMMPYNDGSYVVKNRTWDSPSVVDAGLVVWCSGTTGCLGSADIQTGVSGEVAGGGNQMEYSYDSLHKRLLVSRPAENRVTVLSLSGYNPYEVFVPLVNR
jgi:hypothetical protein